MKTEHIVLIAVAVVVLFLIWNNTCNEKYAASETNSNITISGNTGTSTPDSDTWTNPAETCTTTTKDIDVNMAGFITSTNFQGYYLQMAEKLILIVSATSSSGITTVNAMIDEVKGCVTVTDDENLSFSGQQLDTHTFVLRMTQPVNTNTPQPV